ncbi:MAG: hypothetical protein ACXV47_08575 [Halobacteriota archaeon]
MLIYVGLIAVLVITFSFASGTAKLPSPISYLGIITALGTVIRQWSIAVSGRFFSGALKAKKYQKVVEVEPTFPAYSNASEQ